MKRFPMFRPKLRVTVVGVGSGACRAIDRMAQNHALGVRFVAIDTDTLVLMHSQANVSIRLGESGRSTGGDLLVGKQAALDHKDEIQSALEDAELVFVVSCLGRGTGSGAAPIVADIARETGALTVGVVSHPFQFEGTQRLETAEYARIRMKQTTNTLIPIQNEHLLGQVNRKDSLTNCFRITDSVIENAVRSVMELVTVQGEINIDFADIRTMLNKGGTAFMCSGTAYGDDRATQAIQRAIRPAVQENSIEGARGLIANITTGSQNQMRTREWEEIGEILNAQCAHDGDIKMGFAIDDRIGDGLRVTILATACSPVHISHTSPTHTSKVTNNDPVPPFLHRTKEPRILDPIIKDVSVKADPASNTSEQSIAIIPPSLEVGPEPEAPESIKPKERESFRSSTGFWRKVPAHLR